MMAAFDSSRTKSRFIESVERAERSLLPIIGFNDTKQQLIYTLQNYKNELAKLKSNPNYHTLFSENSISEMGIILAKHITEKDLVCATGLIVYAKRLICESSINYQQQVEGSETQQTYKTMFEENGYFTEACNAWLLCTPMSLICYDEGKLLRPLDWTSTVVKLLMNSQVNFECAGFLKCFNQGLIKPGFDCDMQQVVKSVKCELLFWPDNSKPLV